MFNEMQNCTWPGWETVEMIGRGSFGSVYKIQRNIFGNVETAALKVISIPRSRSDIQELYDEGYSTESITKVFEDHMRNIVSEYSLMRKLGGSANVVSCEDVNYIQHADGIGWDIFIKMELLTPLTAALPALIPEQMVIKLGIDICHALEMCSRHNILHRDIKPQNIFVSDAGDYKLGDFGIAKTVSQTMGGTRIGTPRYMAPEVFNAKPYGKSADLYSLGLVMYWMLNEKRMPFLPLPPVELQPSMDQEAAARRLIGERLPPPAHGSEKLKAIVLKACEYDTVNRFNSAEEMLAELKVLSLEQLAMIEKTDSAGSTVLVCPKDSVALPFSEELDVHRTMEFAYEDNPAGQVVNVQVGAETVQVWIPHECENGQPLFYEGMGLQSVYSEARGNLYLTVSVAPAAQQTQLNIPEKNRRNGSKEIIKKFLTIGVAVCAVILIVVGAVIWGNAQNAKKTSEMYAYILSEADSVQDYYDAILVDSGREEAYLELNCFLTSDYSLSREEVHAINRLLVGLDITDAKGSTDTISVLDVLKDADKEAYDTLCFEFGWSILSYYADGSDCDRFNTAAKWLNKMRDNGTLEGKIASIFCDIADCLGVVESLRNSKVVKTEVLREEREKLWYMTQNLMEKTKDYSEDYQLAVGSHVNSMINSCMNDYLRVAESEQLIELLETIKTYCVEAVNSNSDMREFAQELEIAVDNTISRVKDAKN